MKIILIHLFCIFSFLSLYGQGFDNSLINALSRGGNNKRFKTIKNYVLSDTLSAKYYSKETIDWLGIYKNIVIQIPGKIDSVIYITCHYDKIDGNIISGVNSLINGYLDFLLSPIYFSKGIYDNGSGVIMALRLMKIVMSKENKYSYTFLFTGLEEYGLRGARTHVAKLKKNVYNKIKYVINIDMIGGSFNNSEIGVAEDVSDPLLLNTVKVIAKSNDVGLYLEQIKKTGGTSDFEAFTGTSFGKDYIKSLQFNLIGAFLPQRSYFTSKKKSIPVISFSDRFKISFNLVASGFSPFAFGKIHSFKDNGKALNMGHLEQYFLVINGLIENIEKK